MNYEELMRSTPRAESIKRNAANALVAGIFIDNKGTNKSGRMSLINLLTSFTLATNTISVRPWKLENIEWATFLFWPSSSRCSSSQGAGCWNQSFCLPHPHCFLSCYCLILTFNSLVSGFFFSMLHLLSLKMIFCFSRSLFNFLFFLFFFLLLALFSP